MTKCPLASGGATVKTICAFSGFVFSAAKLRFSFGVVRVGKHLLFCFVFRVCLRYDLRKQDVTVTHKVL